MNWGRIFFALHHYLHLSEEEIKKLSLPKLKIYLEEISGQMEYEIKLHGLEVDDRYSKSRKATAQDIRNFFAWANAK